MNFAGRYKKFILPSVTLLGFQSTPSITPRSKIFMLSRHSSTLMSLVVAKAILIGSRCHNQANFMSGSVPITLFK